MPRAILLTLGFLVGVGAGVMGAILILGGEDAPEEDLSIGVTDASSVRRPTRGAHAQREEEAPIRSSSYEASTQSILDDAAEPEVAAGDGEIRGKVLTEDRRPVPGVLVRAVGVRSNAADPSRWRKGDGPPKDTDLKQSLSRFVERERWSRAARRDAVSDETGAYVIKGLNDGNYSLRAYAKGLEVKPTGGRNAYRIKAGQIMDFVAAPVFTVRVDVRDPQGAHPERAQLEWKDGRRTRSATWYAKLGEVRLAPGTYALTATAGEDDELRSEQQSLILREGDEPPALTFQLKGRTGIKGRIILPEGHGEEHMNVWALRFSGAARPTDKRLEQEGQREWANSYNGFRFAFKDLSVGTWLVGAGNFGTGMLVTATVTVTDGVMAEQDLKVPEPSAEDALVVWVYGPAKQILSDVKINVGRHGRFTFGTGKAGVRKRRDGAYLVRPKKDEQEAELDVKLTLDVSSDRYGRKVVDYPSAGGELSVHLEEPGALDVGVSGYAGSRLEGRLELRLVPEAEANANLPIYRSRDRGEGIGPDGRRTFAPLQPGAYTLRTLWKSERWSQSVVTTQPVTIASGKNAATVTVPALHVLTVIAQTSTGQSRSFSLRLAGKNRSSALSRRNARIDAEGRAVFEGLPAGHYLLSCYSGGSQGSMTVAVPAQSTVVFKPQVETALKVTVKATDGYLAKAGLRTGDVIVGAGGVDFDGSKSPRTILRGLTMAKKEVGLAVLRGGKRLEITVDATKFAAGMAGGALEPASR